MRTLALTDERIERDSRALNETCTHEHCNCAACMISRGAVSSALNRGHETVYCAYGLVILWDTEHTFNLYTGAASPVATFTREVSTRDDAATIADQFVKGSFADRASFLEFD